MKKEEARDNLKEELKEEKKPRPDEKQPPPRPPIKYTNIIQWVTSNSPDRKKIWMIGTRERENFGGIYSDDQVANPGDCSKWYYCDIKQMETNDHKPSNQVVSKPSPWKLPDDDPQNQLTNQIAGIKITKIVTPEHVMVCTPNKSPADGIYILDQRIQNGHIVYKQIENVPFNHITNQDDPYYIQWLKNKTGHYEWIIGKGIDKWVN